MGLTRFTSVVVLACFAVAQGKETTYSFENVAGIYIDLPVTATVNISDGTVATATLNAEDKVVDAANVTLTSAGIFRLELKNATSISSNSSSPNATVSLLVPAGSLSYLSQGGGGSLTVVGGAIAQGQLNVSTTGLGSLRVNNASVTAVQATQSGTGTLIVTGSLGNVSYTSGGLGNSYFSGDIGSVSVSMEGQGSVYISATGSPSITGSVAGFPTVNYDKGSCSVTGGAFGSVCKQGTITLPSGSSTPSSIPTIPTIPTVPTLPGLGFNPFGRKM